MTKAAVNQDLADLVQKSADLLTAPASGYRELLAKRRVLLDQLAARRSPPYGAEELASALRAGHSARSQLLVELGALRAKIDDLRRLRAGLGQLRPTQPAPRSLDVRV